MPTFNVKLEFTVEVEAEDTVHALDDVSDNLRLSWFGDKIKVFDPLQLHILSQPTKYSSQVQYLGKPSTTITNPAQFD